MELLSTHELLDHIRKTIDPLETTDSSHVPYDERILQQFIQNHLPDSLVALLTTEGIVVSYDDIETIISQYTIDRIATIIKTKGQVKGINQIDVIILPFDKSEDNDIFDKLQSIVNLGLVPIFDIVSFRNNYDTSSFIEFTRKKFKELSSSLQNLQEKIQVPNLLLSVHPSIKQLDLEQENFDESLLNDTILLNEVTSIVNGWIRQIQSVTNLSSDLESQTSIADEIQFWTSLDISLHSIEQQLSTIEIKNSINLLNRAKRFHVTLSFTNDTNLSDKLLECKMNLGLLKDLPINDLTSINPKDPESLNKLNSLISNIFNHMKRLRTVNNFPLEKALLITELIVKDIVNKSSELFSNLNLLTLELTEFKRLYDLVVHTVFDTVDINIKYMINLIRELLRKRHEKFIIVRINQESVDQLKQRWDALQEFRQMHETILYIMRNFLQDVEQESKLTTEYNRLSVLNPFDFSKHGLFNWSSTEKLYTAAYSNVQGLISSKLNSLFIDCKHMDDYVAIAEKYRYLSIENAFDILALMKENLRMRILEAAKTEVNTIINCYSKNSSQFISFLSNHYLISTASDNVGNNIDYNNSSIIGSILTRWNLKDKLEFYDKSLSSLVGTEWHKYAIGNKLKEQIVSTVSTLNGEVIFDEFLTELQNFSNDNKVEFKGYIFKIIRTGQGEDIALNLNDRFFYYRDTLLKLSSLGFKVPISVVLQFQRIDKLLPMISDMDESLKIIKKIFNDSLINGYEKDYEFLVENNKQDIKMLLESMNEINWEYLSQGIDLQDMDHDSDLIEIWALKTVLKFSAAANHLNQKLNVITKLDSFLKYEVFHKLRICEFDFESFKSVIDKLATSVNEIYLYENLSDLNTNINNRLKSILSGRCEERVNLLIDRITSDIENDNVSRNRLGADVNTETFMIEISVIAKDQTIFMEPSIEQLKETLVNHLHSIVSTVEGQVLLFNEYFIIGSSLLSRPITNALTEIDNLVGKVDSYYSNWRIIDSLINLNLQDPEDRTRFVKDDSLNGWLDSITRVLSLRSAFDNTSKVIGNCVIDLGLVQTRVAMKFDNFQKHAIKEFGDKYQQSIIEFDRLISKSMKSLNFETLDSSNFISNLVTFVETKRTMENNWKPYLELFLESSKVFQRFNFKFPGNWVYVEQIENKLSSIYSIIDKKQTIIYDNFDFIKTRLESSTNELGEKIIKFKDDWLIKRPISGDMNPLMVLNSLSNFSNDCVEYLRTKDNILKVSKGLQIDIPDISIDILTNIKVEISDFKHVWSSINSLHEQIEGLGKIKWVAVKPREIRLKLEGLLEQCRSLPIKIRQYSAFDDIQQTARSLVKQNKYLVDLKNENIKDRHWKKLLAGVEGNQTKDFHFYTLSDIWNLNLPLFEHLIQSITTQANNERTLEENINKISNKWNLLTFEFFNFNSRLKLVRSWDSLFNHCSQDISELSSMRNSSSFNVFEQEVSQLESKLNAFFTILDIWIEVQRQWVYLDGVFESRNNISNILPIESARFKNLTYEFLDLMRKVYKVELVLDVLLIADIEDSLKKLLESFSKLRRSLSDFLERQRGIFARFYFIGNEDLLELIGSGSDFTKINSHISKLFPGVAALNYDKDSSSITAIMSSQDEVVELLQPVSLIKFPALVEWLQKLELEIKLTLSQLVKKSLPKYQDVYKNPSLKNISEMIVKIPGQVLILCCQILFTQLSSDDSLSSNSLKEFIGNLSQLAAATSSTILSRRKIHNLLIELIHQRDISVRLQQDVDGKATILAGELLYRLDSNSEPLTCLKVEQFGYVFNYGFEYLGVSERLVHTPLIRKCYLTMTQALGQKLGGSPFGPAGTGKTEAIKALGESLGKMVNVFCCDESFDYQSMSRIFLGLCKVGCWGCFDEFNRLNEQLLSAVSSQIESIELGLKNETALIELSGRDIHVQPETGIFVTMNPGYIGRNELPENLKKLFRSCSMEKPDENIIAEVLLATQGFNDSEHLANIVVPFFQELQVKCSKQNHYDFGLRTLKSVLNNCGKLKRFVLNKQEKGETNEILILLRSMQESLLPKLIKEDENVFINLVDKYFPNTVADAFWNVKLMEMLRTKGKSKGLDMSDLPIQKALQLSQLLDNHHGIILVGESGTGKSACWSLLLECLGVLDSREYVNYTIDAKVLEKNALYGSLDPVTREWTDGILTTILRKMRANLRGEMNKVTWIIFDGDIDPEWAENLNSMLDDNKILTLPNGERLHLPPNVKIMFETDSLKSTTLATISRCGMIWFDKNTVASYSLFENCLFQLTQDSSLRDEMVYNESEILKGQEEFVSYTKSLITKDIVELIISEAQTLEHIMDFNLHRYFSSFEGLLSSYYRKVLLFCLENNLAVSKFKLFMSKSILLSFIWSFAGDCPLAEREIFGFKISKFACFGSIDMPSGNFVDYDVNVPEGEWVEWKSKVTFTELEPHMVTDPNTVVSTVDTLRHESLIRAVLSEHKTLLLCGPPGSGKTMIFLEVLKRLPFLDVLQLNFSKESSPESLMKSLKQHCEFQKTSSGLVFSPKIASKWVVVFCDEINLPNTDKYGCQKVVSLMRQMIEHQGFWDSGNMQWVKMRNIQFVGACNSPKDPGRQRLSERFMRHITLLMVDYPGKTSLMQIYETFNSAVMKCSPDLKGYTKSITSAMIDIYSSSKTNLRVTTQAHYVYSPRELTRWSRGLLEALKSANYLNLQEFLRLWFHEGLRLFYDRLVSEHERAWTLSLFHDVISSTFPYSNVEAIMKEPILFSDWLSLKYESVDKEELQKFISHRLATFSEEEIDVQLVLYEDFLIHCLRIDRVLRQPQGHMILVGSASSGKTTMTKFVAWMNGLKTIQLNVYSDFGIEDFDRNLREILIRCCKGEQICYIIDESSIIETSFIERMNTLLANSEIPGLFEGDDYKNLINVCLEESQNQGLLLDSNEELYQWFSQQISVNLHVIFTVAELNNSNRLQVISSPALFNRCVLSYMGNWSAKTLYEVGTKTIEDVPVDISNFVLNEAYVSSVSQPITNFRELLIDIFIFIHNTVMSPNSKQSPGQFMALISNFKNMFTKELHEMEETQRHSTNGLNKLRETVLQVAQLKEELSSKQKYLVAKDQEARKLLNVMLSEQNEAERKQEFSITAQEELNKQEREIERRREAVMRDLAKAEPAILEAKKEVQNIKKQHLSEIRSMTNPPAAVKMTMESVCILTGYEVSSWRDVQLAIRREDFIPNIVNYNNEENLTNEIKKHMEEVYLSRPDYNFEIVNRASKACGPLLQWVKAQLSYSSALNKVGPLKEEVNILEHGAKKARAQLMALEAMVRELQESIESYKNSYSSLIRETESIKMEMETVESKVHKSSKLMENLTTERERWKRNTLDFHKQNETIIGNSILASSFLVYCGEFDHKDRELLLNSWKVRLKKGGIKFDTTVSVLNLFPSQELYLPKGNDIRGKFMDDLTVENIVIIKGSSIPLIIDPSTQVFEMMSDVIGDSKCTTTSFLSASLVKDLENAIRFGGSILIKDSEHYNPILDPVLRKEIHRNGGRLMINIRDQVIDFNPNFKLFMYTRDPSIMMSSFMDSRVTAVNFTITSKNLESQVLNLALRITNPVVEQKRTNIMVLQSQYKEKLKSLETNLLDSLSEVSGSILDDEKVMEYLKSLKQQAKEIDAQIEESQDVLEQIDLIRNKYYDLASHSTLIFEILRNLAKLNYFYSIPLETFTKIFQFTLNNFEKSDTNIMDTNKTLVTEFYKQVYAIISPSLTRSDKIVFATLLTFLYYGKEIGEHFVKFAKEVIRTVYKGDFDDKIWPYFKDTLLIDTEEGDDVHKVIETNSDNETVALLKDILIASRNYKTHPTRFIDALSKLCSFLFSGIGSFSSKYDDLETFIGAELDTRPILLASMDGFDPSTKIEQLSQLKHESLQIVSLGSKEGIELAKKEIQNMASKGDGWLLVQNIQMSPEWLNKLQKILESFKDNNNSSRCKLFFTCNLSSKSIPITLINNCQVMVFEVETNFKRLLLKTYESYDPKELKNRPPEYRYIYFLLCWYHSFIITRLKYVPMSFRKSYDINDSDFAAALNTIDNIILPLIKTGTNISPESIPFKKISYIIGNIIYGAKMEHLEDAKYLQQVSVYLFHIKSFEEDFSLISNEKTTKKNQRLSKPDGITSEVYMQWINELPNEIPFSWIDLPDDINDYIVSNEGKLVSQRVNELLQ